MNDHPPRVLVIDDLFGRRTSHQRNPERATLCGQLLLRDITDDQPALSRPQVIRQPLAEAVFFRGQKPLTAEVGDVIENDLEGCLRFVRTGWSERLSGVPPWALVLLDLCFYTGRVTAASSERFAGMPEGRPQDDEPDSYFGLRILDAVRLEMPDLPVVILSSKPREPIARSIAARGALGFIARGEGDARERLTEYLSRHGLISDTTDKIVGYSIPVLKALRSARRAAASPRHVLLQGEPGVGKELLAEYLHASTANAGNRPWVVVDSGTLSPELFASELFGHRKGAFTNAVADREGRVSQAHGGDLFLDEIGNMPLDVQAGLLRVFQTGHVVPVGADRGKDVEVRVFSATNADVEGKALLGQFRSDLLDRMRSGGTITLPPLRERREDIPLLANRFLTDTLRENKRALIREISPEAMDALVAHEWPGNVRALESCVRKAVASHPDVEYLFPLHFDLPGTRLVHPAAKTWPQVAPLEDEHTYDATSTLIEELARILDNPQMAVLPAPVLSGLLPKLERAYARLTARLLKSALHATSRPTPSEPRGEVLIQPAMKLLAGDQNLTASRAADWIKRLLNLAPEEIDDLLEDRLLQEAYRRALKLRPKGPRVDPGSEQ